MTAQEPGAFTLCPQSPLMVKERRLGAPHSWANKQWPHGKGVLTTLLPKGRKEVKVRYQGPCQPASRSA